MNEAEIKARFSTIALYGTADLVSFHRKPEDKEKLKDLALELLTLETIGEKDTFRYQEIRREINQIQNREVDKILYGISGGKYNCLHDWGTDDSYFSSSGYHVIYKCRKCKGRVELKSY